MASTLTIGSGRAPSVQGHGFLIVTDPLFERMVSVSENIGDLLGAPAEDLIGRKTDDFFSAVHRHDIANVLSHPYVGQRRGYVSGIERDGRIFLVAVHRSADVAIVEWLESDGPVSRSFKGYQKLEMLMDGTASIGPPRIKYEGSADWLCAFAGVDRVSFIEPLPYGGGRVLFDSLGSGGADLTISDLGLSEHGWIDISKGTEMPVQINMDCQKQGIGLFCAPDADGIDTSLCLLGLSATIGRGLSYRGDIRGVLAVPVQANGRLIGIVSCSSAAPLTLDPLLIPAIELAGKLIGMQHGGGVGEVRVSAPEAAGRRVPEVVKGAT